MADTAKNPDKSVTEHVKDHAQSVAEDAREKVGSRIKDEATAARDTVADEMHKHANAADAAASEFDDNSMQAKAIEQVANRIDDIADQVRATDINRLAQSLSDAARRNPLLFVAGAAMAGFAATRFLKARDPHPRGSFDHDDPWSAGRYPPEDRGVTVAGHPEETRAARGGY
jgi:hypothetical protein